MEDLNEVKQKLSKSILATIGQNKCCDSLPALNKAFDILIKETAEKVCDRMTGKRKRAHWDKDSGKANKAVGYNERIFEEKEFKQQILKEIN